MGKTVYIAFAGEYSDRYCVGAYDNCDDAAHASRLGGSDPPDVEEHTLGVKPKHPPGMLAYQVWVEPDGPIESAHVTSADFMGGSPRFCQEVHVGTVAYRCWATDESHAIAQAKAAREQFYRDGGEWMPLPALNYSGLALSVSREDIVDDGLTPPATASTSPRTPGTGSTG